MAKPDPNEAHKGHGSRFAVEAYELSKIYRIFDKPRDRLLAGLPYLKNRKERFRTFEALRDVSFKLERGKTLGIVGKNGSGKSTLLQILCGTLTASSGHVHVSGRIGALLELGSGFNPEFTGIENIELNASILGLSKLEIRERLDDILAFADIGDFVAQPVKTYSSGMVVRLAFAVQAHCDPQVLVVDEALAVGDELFQKKCYLHLEGLKEKGVSIILVTHSCPQINQQCDQALLLHKGQCLLADKPQSVTFLYQQLMNEPDARWRAAVEAYQNSTSKPINSGRDATEPMANGHSESNPDQPDANTPRLDPQLRSQSAISYPSHGGEITRVEILDINDEAANVFPTGHRFRLRFHYAVQQAFSQAVLTCYISHHTGGHVTGQSLPLNEGQGIDIPADSRFKVDFSFEGSLWPGTYFIGGGIASPDCAHRFVHRVVDSCVLRVTSSQTPRIHGSCRMAAEPAQLRFNDQPQATA